MTEQQKFQQGDRVKVTMELTVVDDANPFYAYFRKGTIYVSTVRHWADDCGDHITVELIERPEPPREPGLYLCGYDGSSYPMRWDGADWRWPGVDERAVAFQDDVTVLGTIALNEGVEL